MVYFTHTSESFQEWILTKSGDSSFKILGVIITAILIGCAPQSHSIREATPSLQNLTKVNINPGTSSPTPNPLNSYFLPTYYSDSYTKMIEASKGENGLVIYSSSGEDSWKPVIETFNEHYPWIRVNTITLGANEVFDRYNADAISGERMADLIVTYTPDGWLNFAKSGQIYPYISEEDFFVPPWAKLAPGIYAISSDPLVVIYNKNSISNPPKSMEEIAKLMIDNKGIKELNLTTYDASQNSTGLAVNWYWINQMGNSGWEILRKIGSTHPQLKTSSSSMVSAIQNGEAQIAYFVSPVAFLSQLEKDSNLGWSYLEDGQPLLLRSVAIAQSSPSPNSAKLMVDFLLSQEGQLALALGGMTPFRSDIANVDLFDRVDGVQKHIHFNQIMEAVGINKLIFINFDPEIINNDKRDLFINQWNNAMDN
jgi:iron(III) transport system substrate-binding protein